MVIREKLLYIIGICFDKRYSLFKKIGGQWCLASSVSGAYDFWL